MTTQDQAITTQLQATMTQTIQEVGPYVHQNASTMASHLGLK